MKIAGLAMLAALILMVLRVIDAISYEWPLQLMAGGFEEESLFAIWKFIHGQDVYTNPYAMPFAASYFNWGFYQFYGELVGGVMGFLDLSDAWLPTVGRHVTLAGVIVGFAASVSLYAGPDRDSRLNGALLAALLYVGPLVGFWAFTVRPDIWALTCETIALAVFIRFFGEQRLMAVMVAAVMCYLAWSFKQTNIAAGAAIFLFLVLRRDYLMAVVLAGICAAGVVLAMSLGSPTYRTMLFLGGATLEFDVAAGARHMVNFLAKSTPAWLPLIAALWVALNDKAVRQKAMSDDRLCLGLLGLVVWLAIMVPASTKVGAAENYHFESLLFMGLVVSAATFNGDGSAGPSGIISAARVVGWGLFLGAILYGLGGGARITLIDQHKAIAAEKACLEDLAKPAFSINRYASLPWINPSPPHFVRAYNYELDRKTGKPFEKDGIGGLIESGFFATLLLSHDAGNTFDGGVLNKYERRSELCAGRAIFVRTERSQD